jgi:hypothetical protein
MNFFNRKVRMANWQISLLKLAVTCIAIAIGCYFADFFRPYLLPLVAVGIVTSIWVTIIWIQAMKEDS